MGWRWRTPTPSPEGRSDRRATRPSPRRHRAPQDDETFQLYGKQELDEGSLIPVDGRVFSYADDDIVLQFPGSAFLRANLNGRNEVDEDGVRGAGDPNGTGRAHVELSVDPAELCVTLRVRNIALPAAAAHIHRGRAGENGPVVIPLPTPGEDGRAEGCPSEGVTPELLEGLPSTRTGST